MRTLHKGNEVNQIELLVDAVDVKPFSRIIKGNLEDGIVVKINHYNLENLLCQMLEDYGEEELIKRIKALE